MNAVAVIFGKPRFTWGDQLAAYVTGAAIALILAHIITGQGSWLRAACIFFAGQIVGWGLNLWGMRS